MNLKKYIREIQDFPRKLINFKDISSILSNPHVLEYTINELSQNMFNTDKIIGLDARGFIFGSLLAYKLKKPFIMIRKQGKLPGDCEGISLGFIIWF